MNKRIKELLEQATIDALFETKDAVDFLDNPVSKQQRQLQLEKFAELIVRDMANELFVVYPGGKNGSDVEFQNISIRQWIKQVYGVEV